MNKSTRKNKVRVTVDQDQALMLAEETTLNGFSMRLAEGGSWDNRSMEIAMLVVRETYLNKLHVPQKEDDDVGLRMNHITIRRNQFEPEFEPSRHEMRIFDALDEGVTEM